MIAAARTVAVAFMFVYSVDASVEGCEASTFAHTARGVAAFDLATFRLIFPIFCRFSRSADMDLYFFSYLSSGLAQSPSRRRRPEPYQYAKGEVTWGYPQRSNAAQTG